VEIVSARHAAIGETVEPRLVRRQTPASWDERLIDDGGRLAATIRGPATIALPDATLLVTEGWTASALELGGWIVERA
jgi:hypothetical protein